MWWEEWDKKAATCAEAKDLEAFLALAQQALAAGPDPKNEFLLASFRPLLTSLSQAGRHAESIALIDQLEERFPVAFGEMRHAFARLRFYGAIKLPGADLVQEARRLGPHAAKLSDLIFALPDQLSWEGQLDALHALAEAAWPGMNGSDLVGWAIDQWVDHCLGAVLLTHLRRNPALTADDPSLLSDTTPFEVDSPPGEESEDSDEEEPVGLNPGEAKEFMIYWLRLLRPDTEFPADPKVLARFGQSEDTQAVEQVVDLTAMVAARLRAKGGWTIGQSWVLLQEMGLALRQCAQQWARQSRGSKKADLRALLLPAAAGLLDALDKRNRGIFELNEYAVAAVQLASPVWAGLLAERGLVTEEEARQWQQQMMEESASKWRKIPETERSELARRVIAFAEGEGRSPEAWLK